MNKLLLFFSAGCVGGLANSFAVWFCGSFGVTALANVAIAPVWTPAWLYQRLVWGGIWGLFFILPILSDRLVRKGILLSLLPTLVQLFVVFPLKAHKGIAGLELGQLTPVFVIVFNAIWGAATGLTIRLSR